MGGEKKKPLRVGWRGACRGRDQVGGLLSDSFCASSLLADASRWSLVDCRRWTDILSKSRELKRMLTSRGVGRRAAVRETLVLLSFGPILGSSRAGAAKRRLRVRMLELVPSPTRIQTRASGPTKTGPRRPVGRRSMGRRRVRNWGHKGRCALLQHHPHIHPSRSAEVGRN